MEPKRSPALPQPNVETKKSPPRAAAGGGGGGTAAVGGESPLSSLFHQPSHGVLIPDAFCMFDVMPVFRPDVNLSSEQDEIRGCSFVVCLFFLFYFFLLR
jgi:hypothetical protein